MLKNDLSLYHNLPYLVTSFSDFRLSCREENFWKKQLQEWLAMIKHLLNAISFFIALGFCIGFIAFCARISYDSLSSVLLWMHWIIERDEETSTKTGTAYRLSASYTACLEKCTPEQPETWLPSEGENTHNWARLDEFWRKTSITTGPFPVVFSMGALGALVCVIKSHW